MTITDSEIKTDLAKLKEMRDIVAKSTSSMKAWLYGIEPGAPKHADLEAATKELEAKLDNQYDVIWVSWEQKYALLPR